MTDMALNYLGDEANTEEELAKEMRNASQAEASLIQLMLADNGVYRATDVNANWFASSVWRKVYGAIRALVENGQVADHVTVADEMSAREPNVNWLEYVVDIQRNLIARAESVETYVDIVRSAHTKRQARMIAQRLMSESHKGQAAVDAAIRDLMDLDTEEQRYEHDMKATMRAALSGVEEAFQLAQEGKIVGITTGLADLDHATGGWHNTDLVVIPARPAMGKTALLLNFALNAGVPFGIISSEQAHDQIGMRMLSIEGRVSGSKVRRGKLQEDDWPKLSAGAQRLHQRQFWINDDATITIDGIRRQARKWYYNNGIKILFVDYIQRIYPTDPKLPKHQQIEDITKGLKSLAKELNIPVIALAQVNRECEKRTDRRPLMGDIADASIIEKEADMIMTLYRDEVYNEHSPDVGIAEMGICKSRHGPVGVVRTRWDGACFRFENLALNREGV
jgi:replicative DNA helicase